MPKIFTDIIKPKKIKKEKIVPEKEKKKIPPPKKEEKITPKNPIFRAFLISIVSLIVLVIGLGVFFYYFSFGAKIIISPQQEELRPQLQITVDKNTKDINIFAKIIPGYLFQEEKTVSQDFQASGKVLRETKAEGVIRVYNNYSTLPQVLIVGTRFISSDGKLFRSINRVIVPGQKYEKGKTQPGLVDVKIRADQTGESYNIGPTTFSIPGFAGTPKYTGFYGKSSDSIIGGFKGESSQVTEKDIEKARETLSKKVFEETQKGLKEKISSEFISLDDVRRDKILEISTPQAGTFLDSFKVQIKGVSEDLVIKRADLEGFAKETILFQKPTDKKLYEPSLKIDQALEKAEMDSGKITLTLHIYAKVFSEINDGQLKENIAGKNPYQIKEFLGSQPQIKSSEIKLLPFWAKGAPKDGDRIKIELNLD